MAAKVGWLGLKSYPQSSVVLSYGLAYNMIMNEETNELDQDNEFAEKEREEEEKAEKLDELKNEELDF